MAGHLGNDPGAQAQHSFRQQALNIASSILHFMKDAFDALTNTAKPAVKALSVLVTLIGTARRPNQIVGLVEDLGLPLPSQETLVAKEVTERKVIDHGFCGETFIGVSRYQFIHDWE